MLGRIWPAPALSAPFGGPLLPGLLSLAVVAVIPIVAMVLPDSDFDRDNVPAVTAPVPTITPSEPHAAFAERLVALMQAQPAAENAPPLEPNPELLDPNSDAASPLPITASNGLASFDYYVRPASPIPDGPVISIVVTGLGLNADLSEKSVALPGQMALAYSPYADHGDHWHRFARWSGHESLLMIATHPADFPRSDRGPLALHPKFEETELQARLLQSMQTGSGYMAATIESDVFAGMMDRLVPITEALAERGIGLIELGGDRLAATAGEADLPYLSIEGPLDQNLTPQAIDQALGALEAQALMDGMASGYLRAYPVSLDRLWTWAADLQNKGITLVPISQMAEANR